jgi:hypothetical protein
MNSLFLKKLSIIKENSINLSRNYINNGKINTLYKPILSFQDETKRNSNNNINNSIKLLKTRNLFLKKLTNTNNSNEIKNYYYNHKKTISLDRIDKNIKIDKKTMRLKKEMKSLSPFNPNISKSNKNIYDFPNIKLNKYNSLNSFYSINNSNTIDNDLIKSSSAKKIENIFLIDDKKLFQNKLIPIKKKKEDIINIFRKNKLNSKLTVSSIIETNINSKSQKEQIENPSQQLSVRTNTKKLKDTNNSFFNKTEQNIITDKIESKVKKDIIENKIKLILRKNTKSIENIKDENNKDENNEQNDLLFFKSSNLKNIKWKIPRIKKAVRKKIIEEILNFFLSEIPKNKNLDFKKKLLKKSKILIKNDVISIINNNLSVKSPYEDKKSYFKRIKKEFLKENNEENNFDDKFITFFNDKSKEEISIKINYSNHLVDTYFNYKKEFLHYLFYGDKKARRRSVIISHVFTSKTKSFFYHLDLKNLIFINKFFLNDNFDDIKKEISNPNSKIIMKKFPKRLSNLSELILNPHKEVKLEKMKFQIYNFKRIFNKLENISILKRKDNLRRIKKKKSIIYQKEINSDMVFRCLCYYIYYNDSKEFIKCFLQFKDMIDIEQTDSKYNTLLTLSVKYNCFKIFKFLIEKGANVNTQNIYLNTPLHYAFASKLYKFIDLLIINGADENLKNIYGKNYFECVNNEEN